MHAYQSWSIEREFFLDEDGEECYGEEYALIDKIFVPAGERGHGVGTALLREAIAEIRAEHGGICIKLAALPCERGIDMQQLVEWYEREGFSVEDTSGEAVVMVL